MDIISKNQYHQESKCRFAGCKIHLCKAGRNARMSRLWCGIDIYVCTKIFPAASQKMDIISKNQYHQESKCRFAGCKIHLCKAGRNARMSRLSLVQLDKCGDTKSARTWAKIMSSRSRAGQRHYIKVIQVRYFQKIKSLL